MALLISTDLEQKQHKICLNNTGTLHGQPLYPYIYMYT